MGDKRRSIEIKGKAGEGINKRYLALTAVLFLLMIIFSCISNAFFSFSNIMNILKQSAALAIVSVGVTFVILTGGVDLSVPNNIAICGLVTGIILNRTNNAFFALIATLVCGAVVGFVNGELVGRFKLHSFIATLSTNTVLGGICVYITNGKGISIEGNDSLLYWGRGDIAGVPVSLLILIIVFAFFVFVSLKTKFGREIFAIGGSADAARAIGINVERKMVLTYMMAGALVGLAAVVNVGRLGSSQPYAGNGMDFEAITAVVLGGTSLSGGVGGVVGTIFGVFLVGVMTNGLGLLSISQYFLFIIKGVMILAVVGIDLYVHRRSDLNMTPKIDNQYAGMAEKPGTVNAVQKAVKRTLVMHDIIKAYPGMRAVNGVTLKVESGTVHALMGENGAGKSTLMQILLGENEMSAGYISINDEYVNIDSPKKAEQLGISMIHQENALVKSLSIAENMFLGKEKTWKLPVFLNKAVMNMKASAALKQVGLNISPKTLVKNLTVSEQQLVEIAKALSYNAWLIVMDEPTSSLTLEETDKLFEIIHNLRSNNKAIIYISHRMQEIYQIADCMTILRDGQFIDSKPVSELTEDQLIQKMVGRELNNIFDREPNALGEVVLKVEHLSKAGMFEDISFEVRAGEVLGFGGLVGAGRTEIMKSIFGFYPADSGSVLLDGKVITGKSISQTMKAGVAYLTEDRKLEGFVPYMSIAENIAMPSYGEFSKFGIISSKKTTDLADEMIEALHIKTTSRNKNVIELSGGNQQKVSLGKWLARDLRVLILDEPTRGVDIGAKEEIHKIIGEFAKRGIAVILISSEMPELIGCSDRVAIIRNGKISGIVGEDHMVQDELMRLAVL